MKLSVITFETVVFLIFIQIDAMPKLIKTSHRLLQVGIMVSVFFFVVELQGIFCHLTIKIQTIPLCGNRPLDCKNN
jgi:hypothetical protein